MYNLENYDSVADRISKFYELYPNGVICHKIISPLEKIMEYVLVEAEIWFDKKEIQECRCPDSIGRSFSKAGDKGADSDAWVENAETSAIGRALANRDIWIKRKGASASEMKKVGTQSGDPASGIRGNSAQRAVFREGQPTYAQIEGVRKALASIGIITDEAKKAFFKKTIGKEFMGFHDVGNLFDEINNIRKSGYQESQESMSQEAIRQVTPPPQDQDIPF